MLLYSLGGRTNPIRLVRITGKHLGLISTHQVFESGAALL